MLYTTHFFILVRWSVEKLEIGLTSRGAIQSSFRRPNHLNNCIVGYTGRYLLFDLAS
jgi:hypothetical protein